MTNPGEDQGLKHARHLAEHMQVTQEAVRRASRAKTAGEWFDIFADITITGVRQGLEANNQGHLLSELLAPQKPVWDRVRARFAAQGLELNEGIEIDGPVVQPNVLGVPEVVDWPKGLQAEFTWTDGTRLMFKGHDALVATAFIQWWSTFNQVHMHQFGTGSAALAPKTRLIDPGSNEYINYIMAKQREQQGL